MIKNYLILFVLIEKLLFIDSTIGSWRGRELFVSADVHQWVDDGVQCDPGFEVTSEPDKVVAGLTIKD